jgi:chemotaxis protein histidine kinase CheA
VFRLRVPASMSVLPALEVEADGQAYLLPLTNVARVVQLPGRPAPPPGEEIFAELDGHSVVVRELAPGLRAPGAGSRRSRPAVLLAVADRRALYVVDRVGRQRDVVVRALSELLRAIPGVSGCAETASGRAVLVLDPAALVERPLVSEEVGT